MKKLTTLAASCITCAAFASMDYPVKEADMTNVTITAGFWLPRFETNRVVTVKYLENGAPSSVSITLGALRGN